jgi:hypothetical protein
VMMMLGFEVFGRVGFTSFVHWIMVVFM